MSAIIDSLQRVNGYLDARLTIEWDGPGAWHAVLAMDVSEEGERTFGATGATPEQAVELAVRGWEQWRDAAAVPAPDGEPSTAWYFNALLHLEQSGRLQIIGAAQNDA